MKTVYKYQLDIADSITIRMPCGAKIVHVGLDPQGVPCLWAHVDRNNVEEARTFVITGTGNPVPDFVVHHGSFVQAPFVWHVWGYT